MLLLPVLVGVAVSRPNAWQAVLGATALSAYLASAALQAWSRGRHHPAYRPPMLAFGAACILLGALLLAAFPALALSLVVLAPTAVMVFRGAQPGTPRDLANSAAQVAQALVLVPATAWVSGAFEPSRVVLGTLVAAGYLVGTVLVVRSVLRERGNRGFAVLSASFHVALVAAAAFVLPAAYALLAAALAARAIVLPIAQRRWAGGPHPLRPLHVGVVEIVASVAVVVVAFAVSL
jgi:hypothetical protein